MIEHVGTWRDRYYDSVVLMLASKEVTACSGVAEAAIAAATPLNTQLLARQGFAIPSDVGPNDIVIAIRALDHQSLQQALMVAEHAVRGDGGDGTGIEVGATASVQSVRAARKVASDLNVVVLSVPRQWLSYEIASCIDEGTNVFCFSDGLSVEEELYFKTQAAANGLMLMGPDCGTALLDGYGFGFSNVVRRGSTGIVGASGTGIQEVTCSLDRAGLGVSNAIGVGGRDLSAEVGGIMTVEAIRRLANGPLTRRVLVLSKPPATAVATKIANALTLSEKPAAMCFLGWSGPSELDGMPVVGTLEAATQWAIDTECGSLPPPDLHHKMSSGRPKGVRPEVNAGLTRQREQGALRGLFSGGTLAYEAMSTLVPALGQVQSNLVLPKTWMATSNEAAAPQQHSVIDFGADEFTEGRAHPMIDPSLRLDRFDEEARKPDVTVVLMDLVLGLGSPLDAPQQMAEHVAAAMNVRGDALAVVVSICGTDHDPQDASVAAELLARAGARTAWTASAAARMAVAAMRGGRSGD